MTRVPEEIKKGRIFHIIGPKKRLNINPRRRGEHRSGLSPVSFTFDSTGTYSRRNGMLKDLASLDDPWELGGGTVQSRLILAGK